MSLRILLLAHDNKIGDSIILTGVLKPILEKFPKLEFDILCGQSNYQIYKYNPNINKIGAIFCQKYRGIKNAIYPKIKPNNIYMDCLIK